MRRALLLLVFFASGISALIYQVVWLKYLGLIFGNTVYAAATLIAIFLAGLGIGSEWFSRWFSRRSPLHVYAALEAGIGLFGAFSPNAFGFLDDAYIATFRTFEGAPLMLGIARAVVCALFLLPPTILMGGTLPVLVRWWGGLGQGRGTAVSALYAINTLGAAAGVALAGFYTIPRAGLLMTILLAVVLNFSLALTAAFVAYRGREAATPATQPEVSPSAASTTAGRWLIAVSFLMGLTSIADEVFWSRIFVLHLGSSVYAYSLMLFAFLIGIGLGSAVIYRVIDRINPLRALAVLEIALAAVLALQIHYLTRLSSVVGVLSELLPPTTYDRTLLIFLAAVLTAIVLPTAIMGATFPLVVRAFETLRGTSESRAAGVVYFANTVGSIAGSILAGFILIRAIGTQNGLFAMAAVNLVLGVILARKSAAPSESARRPLALAAAAFLILFGAFILAKPHGVILSAGIFTEDAAPILAFKEDVSATIALRKLDTGLSLELNGVNVAGTGPDLIGTQKLQGHIPLLLHRNPRSVLHIGFGSGGTAEAVSLHDVERIRIVEISREVLEVSDTWLRSVNHGVLSDKRVETDINDGRNYVMAAPQQFDVILSDSIHPRYAGNGSLYTKDYFELCRKRLAPGGVISMWLPMYSMTTRNFRQILRAFQDVFPHTTVWYVTNYPNSFTIVIGRLDEQPIDLRALSRRVTAPVAADLATIGIHTEYDLASALLLDPHGVASLTRDDPPHIDDIPAVEYESGRILDRERAWLENFAMLGRALSPLPRAFQVADPAALTAAGAIRRQRFREHYRAILGSVRQERRVK